MQYILATPLALSGFPSSAERQYRHNEIEKTFNMKAPNKKASVDATTSPAFIVIIKLMIVETQKTDMSTGSSTTHFSSSISFIDLPTNNLSMNEASINNNGSIAA
ncbi:hypothetical protein GHN41_11335 [Pseudomonas helleri]|uniref:Uncharacterized protein n=1 Tax=Pseudomonas helleri TaxID=1608996 RepID=A0A6G1W412_9PSED|nr:hypothetical protein [Pseudomonas helleri]MQT25777.1 hypothetical protein [Pseudomonas helleri]MQU17028.1 hypothetical protein [Pseudomonas helleri]